MKTLYAWVGAVLVIGLVGFALLCLANVLYLSGSLTPFWQGFLSGAMAATVTLSFALAALSAVKPFGGNPQP